MQISNIPTDESSRSTLSYGTDTFPFVCYTDEIAEFPGQYIEWHWHREFEFVLAIKGNISCKIGNQAICLYEGNGLFINSEVFHQFTAEKHGTLASLIFAPEFIASPDSALFSNYVYPFLSSDLDSIHFDRENSRQNAGLQLIKQAWHLASEHTFLRELQIRNKISLLWETLAETAQNHLTSPKTRENKRTHSRLQKMLEYIHNNYFEQITLSSISASANISQSEALRCFHACIQTTPINYLNGYRLHRAKEYLISSNDTVTSIAAAVGFESVGYFCRVFKSKYGCSPNVFRDSFQRNQYGNHERQDQAYAKEKSNEIQEWS
ncbi:MAG: AraC family transcriptional regulator [Eubacterium sp.]|nr:AraC family transcriptional regulator [Eubacterium sp.]